MKRNILALTGLLLLCGCSGLRVTKPMLSMMVAGVNQVSGKPAYADSLEKRLGIGYVPDGTASQVVDIYYAAPSVRKDAVLIDIHGGFYIAGKRENNRTFASVFLRKGYDVVLLEYRVNDGETDVSDALGDCAAALDYLCTNAEGLGLNKERMFLTGDSAGGHLVLYMAEGASEASLPIRPQHFKPRGVLLNCPAYDFASFADGKGFTPAALAWFMGPKYEDRAYLESRSPRTYLSSYPGPLFVSTCSRDFIRGESLKLKADCDSLGRNIRFLDIASGDKKVGHVHNVVKPHLPQSKTVNDAMISFMDAELGL